ncbi:hypothetical protein [Macrococcus capreoli]
MLEVETGNILLCLLVGITIASVISLNNIEISKESIWKENKGGEKK